MLSKTHSKYIQSLHHKKFRDAEQVFFAEGNKVVTELIASRRFECREVLATEEWLLQHNEFLQQYCNSAISTLEPHELEKISALSTPNQVMALFKKAPAPSINSRGKLSLALDTIQDPGNLGTIIRIADWFGIGQLICSADSADMYNPKVVQSTMGSLGRVQVLYTGLQDWLATQTVPIYAAALDGKPVQECRGVKEGILVIGNESKGISNEILSRATQRVTIPRIGEAESLNAAVATGILLSHMATG